MRSTRVSLEVIVLSTGNLRFSEGEGAGGTGSSDDGKGGTGGAGDASKTQDGAGPGGDSDEDDLEGLKPEELRRKLRNRAEQARRQDAELRDAKAKATKADELQAELDKVRRKEQDEVTNLKEDVTNLTEQLSKKDELIRRLTVENAFMAITDIKWHNPARALTLVDLSEVEFDESGTVKDPKAVLKAAQKLAKDEPYLVKSKTAAADSTPEGKPTGTPPAGSGNGGEKLTDEARLRAKYKIRR